MIEQDKMLCDNRDAPLFYSTLNFTNGVALFGFRCYHRFNVTTSDGFLKNVVATIIGFYIVASDCNYRPKVNTSFVVFSVFYIQSGTFPMLW